MAKASPSFSNFTAGELSPRLDGRTDLQKYFNGCKTLENFVVHPHGGASRRPGSIFVREVKNSANNARLIPFEFNVEQAYILEFGDQYFRIHKDGGTVVTGSPAAPVEVTTPYLHTELDDLKFTQSADVMYIVHPNHAPRKITRTSHTAWTITAVDFQRGPFQDANTDSTTLTASARTGSVTITASADTFDSDDVGRLVKLHHGFAKISAYTSATSVTATVQETADGRAELAPSYTATTISFHEGDPSATGLEHNDRIQDSAGNFIEQGFEVGMRISTSGASNSHNNQSDVLIVQVTDDSILISPSGDFNNANAGDSITVSGDLNADSNFALGAFSATTGYPAAITFYEQRLVMASTTDQPQTIFFSVGGSFEDFTAGIGPSDALTYTLGSNQVNVIRYLQAGRVLLVGTSGGEFVVTSSEDAPLSPTNAVVKRQATYGSANIQPVQVANVTLFVQRARRKLRELVFDLNTDSYQAPDMTLLAEHITESGIKEMALQQEPDNVVWCVLENGKLVGMTYRREENVIAWHEHTIGGAFGSDSFGHVESVASIPGSLDEDATYLVVKRTINGATKRFVEYFNFFDFGDNILDAYFVDSGLTYTGSAATSISGLDHLEGETVRIVANGSTHPDKVVSSGSVTLDFSTTNAHIGLAYTSTLQTMRLDAGGTEGTSQAKIKRIHDVTLRLFRTVGAEVGSSTSELDRIPFRSSADEMDTALPLFTGDKEVEFRGGFDTDAFIVVRQSQAMPMTILSIFPRLITFDQ